MQQILDLLGVYEMETMLRSRLIYSSFCFLVFIILIYFYWVSREKLGANKNNSQGLIFFSFAFLTYCIIGFASVYKPAENVYLILSGLTAMCLFLSLPFFSLSTHRIDEVVEHLYWKNTTTFLGFLWILIISWTSHTKVVYAIDRAISALALTLLGFFFTRYFLRRNMRFLAAMSVIYFLSVVTLQILPPESLQGGKFVHMNMIILGPALLLSVITLAYTFNWINELNFYELSNIWVNENEDETKDNKATYSKLTLSASQDTWLEKIANDDLEKVIDEMIIFKKHKSQKLETILNIASRNTRNNNNRLKDTIDYQDYQLNRNKISEALIAMISS